MRRDKWLVAVIGMLVAGGAFIVTIGVLGESQDMDLILRGILMIGLGVGIFLIIYLHQVGRLSVPILRFVLGIYVLSGLFMVTIGVSYLLRRSVSYLDLGAFLIGIIIAAVDYLKGQYRLSD